MSDDKRRNPRIDLNLSVMIRGKQGMREVKNFGLYGVFVRTENPDEFQTGDEVFLAMRLPLDKQAMQVRGRVAHISAKGIGVEFTDVPPQQAMSMEHCFSVFKSTVPMPGT